MNILSLLGRQPQKITHIAQKVNVNQRVLAELLDFMERQQLIMSKKITPKRKVLTLTKRGKTALSYFQDLHQVVPIETVAMVKVKRRVNEHED